MTLTDLAESIMFGTIKTKEELEKRIEGHWEFRKGKGVSDINDAVKKGVKMGMGKTEDEIEGVALYFKDVFKPIKR